MRVHVLDTFQHAQVEMQPSSRIVCPQFEAIGKCVAHLGSSDLGRAAAEGVDGVEA